MARPNSQDYGVMALLHFNASDLKRFWETNQKNKTSKQTSKMIIIETDLSCVVDFIQASKSEKM